MNCTFLLTIKKMKEIYGYPYTMYLGSQKELHEIKHTRKTHTSGFL